jgi:hydrogenase maturation protease
MPEPSFAAHRDVPCDLCIGVDKTVVLGVGNALLADEGAGIHAIRRMQSDGGWDDGVEFVDGGTLSFTLAQTIEDTDRLIVVDAADFGSAPGTVRVFEGVAMDAFLGGGRKRSVHEVGLIDLMAIALLADRLPARRALVAIQLARVDWSEEPSKPVALAIPGACAATRELIARWSA